MKPLIRGGLALIIAQLLGCAAGSDDAALAENAVPNRCTLDADCDGGHCMGTQCVAASSAIDSIALEVIAPASVGAGDYQQMRYLQTIALGTSGARDILLERVSTLSVAIRSPTDGCDGLTTDKNGLIPVRVEVMQNPRINGISSSSYLASSGATKGFNEVTVRVPPGLADIYVEPTEAADSADGATNSDCVLVPFLGLGQNIRAGEVPFEQRIPVARRVSVDVVVPVGENGSSPLDGFTLDMVEPLYGMRVSTRAVLSATTITDGKAHHTVTLAYQPVVGQGAKDLSGRELFRLKPKESASAPVYYVARVAADPFGTDHAVVDQITSLPTVVSVSGRIESESGGVATASQVTAVLRGTGDSSTGAVTVYRVTTTSDSKGRFQLSLVSGTYDVAVSPTSETRVASRLVEWTIAPGPSEQAGKLVALPAVATLTGKVVGATETAASWSANVLAVPSSNIRKSTFIESLIGTAQLISRRTSVGAVNEDGTFELSVDPGAYDVFIRPTEGSGLPWAVRPSTMISEGSLGLGPIRISAPFAYSGAVTVPGSTEPSVPVILPGALVRAFALFDENGRLVGSFDHANRAVQIGETRATSEGHYELRLPASLE